MHTPVPPAVAHAHAELLTHQDLQFDFPKFVPPVTPQWMIELGKLLARLWPYIKYAGWIAAAPDRQSGVAQSPSIDCAVMMWVRGDARPTKSHPR